ncbi:hypothetical protein [Blastopirellula marina]|uniref:Uncharacterized protein n=1 Tax=Blastopirellula marina TaxID=124 RepID=A0A2S8GMI5_9BACT|nr:hypothetical protein [Blastopirellula marina]PQO45635.1 hypothetical protein C5Y93_14460 [Blastopirellula marina]
MTSEMPANDPRSISRRLLVLIPFLLVTGLGIAAADAKEMAAWKKDVDEGSYFVDVGQGTWLEVEPGGKEFRFAELERKEGGVELIDRRRNIKIRLLPQWAELSVNGNAYRRWVPGKWVKTEDLPEFAQISPIDHKVRLIYFLPTDREPTANYREKINTLMHFVNETYKFEFRRRGLPDRGLVFETDEEGVPIVHLLHGKEKAQYYNGAPNYDPYFTLRQVRPEIPKSIGNERTHLVITFMETYDDGPNRVEWPGGIALGGWRSADGGTANFSAWVLQDMFCATTVAEQRKLFFDATPIEGRTALGHGRQNSPRFEFIEDGMGAVIHEVGHALGLPHDQRDDRHYIMGNGFRKMRDNLNRRTPVKERARFSDANARILAQSRLLNPKVDLTDEQPPKVEVSLEPGRKPNTYRVKVKAADDKGLKAVLYYDDVRGSVVDGDDLAGKEDTNEMELELRTDGEKKEVRLEVKVIDQGGNIVNIRANRPTE